MKRAPAMALLAGLLIVVGLPIVAHWRRPARMPGCALDGEKINAAYRVAIVDSQGQPHAFCCVRCAQIWVTRDPMPPRCITVTDEASGTSLDAWSAWYVRSAVVSVPASGNRIHVFGSPADAAKHADTYSGVVLGEGAKPFRRRGG